MMRNISTVSAGINTSTSRILGAHSFIRGEQSTLLSINRSKNNTTDMNQNFLRREEEIEESPILVSHSVSIADPNDFGYFKIVKKRVEGDLNDENLMSNQLKSNFANKNKSKFLNKKLNLLCKMNEFEYNEKSGKEEKMVKSNKELVYQYAREENDYKNFEVPSITDILAKTGEITKASRKSKLLGIERNNIMQTGNSYIIRKQHYEISHGNNEHALQLNFEYSKRKERFEVNLIFKLLQKYEASTKPGSKLILKYPEPYIELKRESSKLIDKYNKTTNQDKFFLNEIRGEAMSCMLQFIKRIEKEVDDKPVKSNEIEVKQFKNYSKWKKKISELVNIWELFQSNGIDLRFPVKYLVLKRFLSNRASRRQNVTDLGSSQSEAKSQMMSKLFTNLISSTGSKFMPRSIIMPDDTMNLLIEFFSSCLLIFSLFIIPMIQFLDLYNEQLESMQKFIDVFFYIEITMNFRKVFKDKNNEYVYNLKSIMKSYMSGLFLIDFISTIPWYFFVISNSSLFAITRTWVMCIKIFRISKLSEISNRIEATKYGNYFRLFKLIFIFLFFAHWLGCILFTSVTTSMDFTSLSDNCFTDNLGKTKDNVTMICKYMFSVYNSAYIIPGQYTTVMNGIAELALSSEYGIYIVEYLIGQILSAYIFGGLASIIQTLNQGQNLYSNKMDMLNEHMMFYDVDNNTMSDVKIYFKYLWQRHKDVIYGKKHFDLLSKSLREKFETLNLPGNEILLAKFYNLNPGNTKLIGTILTNLSKTILFPFEILFEVGSVSKGIYILLNGDLTLYNDKIQNLKTTEYIINYADVKTTLQENEKNKTYLKPSHYDEKDSVIFPLISAFIKTGRNWQRCHSQNFTDLLFLPNVAFDELIFNFPIEMHLMKHHLMDWVVKKKLFDNKHLFKLLSTHSSRSVSKYFEKEFDKFSIWIPIPIPISQRKIAGNYIESFIKKVRNQWREILLIGDLNMCLNSYSAVTQMQNQGKKDEKEGNNDGNKRSKDPVDQIRGLTKEIDRLTSIIVEKYDVDEKILGQNEDENYLDDNETYEY